MANDRMKSNENVYFRARKEAAKYNDNLNSRGAASELLGVSESSLSDYELGLTKVVPVDKLSVVITLVLAFVFLHEQFTPKSLIGCVLIGIGTLIMVL